MVKNYHFNGWRSRVTQAGVFLYHHPDSQAAVRQGQGLEELASLCSAISLSRMAGATRILKPIQGGWCQSFHLLPLRQLSRADQRREG